VSAPRAAVIIKVMTSASTTTFRPARAEEAAELHRPRIRRRTVPRDGRSSAPHRLRLARTHRRPARRPARRAVLRGDGRGAERYRAVRIDSGTDPESLHQRALGLGPLSRHRRTMSIASATASPSPEPPRDPRTSGAGRRGSCRAACRSCGAGADQALQFLRSSSSCLRSSPGVPRRRRCLGLERSTPSCGAGRCICWRLASSILMCFGFQQAGEAQVFGFLARAGVGGEPNSAPS